MKKVIEAKAAISGSNRDPIVVIQGSKVRSLEEVMKELIGDELSIVSVTGNSRWRASHKNKQPDIIHINSCTVKEILPHAKTIKVTIEIE